MSNMRMCLTSVVTLLVCCGASRLNCSTLIAGEADGMHDGEWKLTTVPETLAWSV